MPDLKIYQRPGGPVIGSFIPGQKITILYGREIFGGLIWVEIVDSEGRIGWIPESFVKILLPTLTPILSTSTPAPTSTPMASFTSMPSTSTIIP